MQPISDQRDRLIELRRELTKFKDDHDGIANPSDGLVGAVTGQLEKRLGGRVARIRFYQWVFDDPFIASVSNLYTWQRFALVNWAKPAKLQEDGPWTYSKQFMDDCSIIRFAINTNENGGIT